VTRGNEAGGQIEIRSMEGKNTWNELLTKRLTIGNRRRSGLRMKGRCRAADMDLREIHGENLEVPERGSIRPSDKKPSAERVSLGSEYRGLAFKGSNRDTGHGVSTGSQRHTFPLAPRGKRFWDNWASYVEDYAKKEIRRSSELRSYRRAGLAEKEELNIDISLFKPKKEDYARKHLTHHWLTQDLRFLPKKGAKSRKSTHKPRRRED